VSCQMKMPEIFTSKKFQVFIAGVIAVLSQDDVPGLFAMSEVTIGRLVKLTMIWMGAQGAADIGKEKAKIEKG